MKDHIVDRTIDQQLNQTKEADLSLNKTDRQKNKTKETGPDQGSITRTKKVSFAARQMEHANKDLKKRKKQVKKNSNTPQPKQETVSQGAWVN